MPHTFDSIPPTPHGHFLLHFYGTILRLLRYIDRMGAFGEGSQAGLNAQFPFLAHYREQIELFLPPGIPPEKAVTWWEEEVGSWQARVPVYLPLTGLEGMKGIGSKGRAALMAAGLVQEDLAWVRFWPTCRSLCWRAVQPSNWWGSYWLRMAPPSSAVILSMRCTLRKKLMRRTGSAWEITRELIPDGSAGDDESGCPAGGMGTACAGFDLGCSARGAGWFDSRASGPCIRSRSIPNWTS